jgi:hypothetical protein
MGGIHPIRNVLRIDNVETLPAERITANDEDRQRQGFEIQTVFAWPWRDNKLDVATSVARRCRRPDLVARLCGRHDHQSAEQGRRRRKDKSIFGFAIDPRWALDRQQTGRGRRRA